MMLAWLFLASHSLQGTPGEVILGTYKIDGQPVQAKLAVAAPSAGGIDWNGSHLVIGEDGRFKSISRPVKDLYDAAAARLTDSTPVWRVKFMILTRGDILDYGADGLLRQRRSIFYDSQVKQIKDSIALFCSMAEAYAGGKLKVDPDVSFEYEPLWFDATAKGLDFNVKAYLEPRVNGGLYEADDKVYRGPYDSIFCIHSFLGGSDRRFELSDMPVTEIPFYQDWQLARPNALAERLLGFWATDVLRNAGRDGFADLAKFRTDDYRAMLDPTILDGALRARNGEGIGWPISNDFSPAGIKYSSAAWAKLPELTPAQTGAEILGSTKVKVGDADSVNLDGILDIGVEAAAISKRPTGTWLFVDSDYAEFFSQKLGSEYDAHALGYLKTDFRRIVVFKLARDPGRVLESALVGESPPSGPSPDKLTEPCSAESPASCPLARNWVCSKDNDVDRGEVLKVTNDGPVYSGSVELLRTRSLDKTPYLDFWLKTDKPEPIVLRLSDDASVADLPVFDILPTPAELSLVESNVRPMILDIRPDGTWQHFAFDLRELAKNLNGVGAIRVGLASNSTSVFWESKQAKSPILFLDDWRLAAQTDAPVVGKRAFEKPAADASSSDPLARAISASNASESSDSLLKLVSDDNEFVALNALAKYRQLQDPKAEPLVIQQTRHVNARVADMAWSAWINLNPSAANDQARKVIVGGLSETGRRRATQVIAFQKNKANVGLLSTLLAARSWQTRLAGAEALGQIPGKESSIVLLAFLQELDPSVRAAATRLASPEQDLVCRRFLWSSVNDPSDEVRKQSYLGLIRSPIDAYRKEGFKGVRDDSRVVRLSIVESITQSAAKLPAEDVRNALRLAVADSSAAVRAASLQGFRALNKPIAAEEIQNTFADEHPAVQMALLDLAEAKLVALPSATLEKLKSSPYPSVAEKAKKLNG